MRNGNTWLFILILYIDLVTQRNEDLDSQPKTGNVSVVSKSSDAADIIALMSGLVLYTEGN